MAFVCKKISRNTWKLFFPLCLANFAHVCVHIGAWLLALIGEKCGQRACEHVARQWAQITVIIIPLSLYLSDCAAPQHICVCVRGECMGQVAVQSAQGIKEKAARVRDIHLATRGATFLGRSPQPADHSAADHSTRSFVKSYSSARTILYIAYDIRTDCMH